MKGLKDILRCSRGIAQISLGLYLTISLTSCLEEPKVQLLQIDKEYMDSIFSDSITSLKDDIDSLCILQRNELFDTLVDSIKQKRLEEIQSIFNEK